VLLGNWRWIRAAWRKRLLGKHRQVVTMSLIFLAAALTGMGAWATSWTLVGVQVEKLVVEIDDKLTLFLTVFLLFHVWSRRKRLAH
jgi:DNA-binding transcriptional LysR family regulator